MIENEVIARNFKILMRYTHECPVTITACSEEEALKHAKDFFWELFDDTEYDINYGKQVALKGDTTTTIIWEDV